MALQPIILRLFQAVFSDIFTEVRSKKMKTFSAKPAEVRRDWFVIDATGKTLGRMATEIARRLRGKHKPEYTPHVDTGDYIVVINAEKVAVTGNKQNDKMYHTHSGYPGGIKSMSFDKMVQHAPERIIEIAVKGMLPKNPLGRAMVKKLKIYSGPDHNHAAQQPKVLEI
jgi:large subunit ribosomal protein L13